MEIFRILPCFQEEMMVQEDLIELEKMAWSKKKQIKVKQFPFHAIASFQEYE